MALEPADCIRLETAGGARLYRIQRITDAGHRLVTATAILTRGEPPPQTLPPRAAPAVPALSGRALALVVDLPLAVEPGAPTTLLAVHAEPFTAQGLWRSVSGTAWSADPPVTARAIIGRTLTALPAGRPWRTHRAVTFEVELLSGSLHSVDPVDALDGRNWLAVGDAATGYEVLSFDTAELTGPRRFRLSGLVRGLGGSEALSAVERLAGQRVVLLDGTLAPLAGGPDMLGRETRFRLTKLGRDHGDPDRVEFAATPGTAALMPLAPVHATARRSAGGIEIGFFRRARLGGDSLDLDEPQLGEERESYRIEIMNGAAVARVIDTPSPQALYPAAEEATDFGGPVTALSVRIRQWSRVAGHGHPLVATLSLA
jgi:hypothetical protein